jgi:hypothetical protein
MLMIQLDERLIRRMAKYKGLGTTLGSAVGALAIGKIYGWRVVVMIHSLSTVRKFNEILGVRIQDVCSEYTELSRRSFGIRLAEKVGAFWKIAKGSYPGKSTIGQK